MPEPTKHFNFIQVTLGVSPIETVAPAAGKPVGTIAFATDTEAFYEVCQTAANAHVWKPMGGAGTSGWSKYVVSGQATPIAQYSTITQAITAAVADGHTTAAPAVVLVLPGTYVEDVTLADGVSLQGFGGFAEAVIIQGTVLAGLDTNQTVTVRDLTIVGQFHVGSTKNQGVTLLNVTVQSTGVALFDDNTGTVSLFAFNCRFVTSSAVVAAYQAATARTAKFRECQFLAPTNGTAAALTASGSEFFRCDVSGAVTAATSGTATFLHSRVRTTVNPCFTIGLGATVEATNCYLDSGGTKAFDGTGGFRASANTYPNGITVGTSLTPDNVHAPSILRLSFTNVSGAFPQDTDVLLVDCSGGDVTITLPLIASVLPGRPLQVKSQTNDGVHRAILATSGGQTIDGAATFNCALAKGWCEVAAQTGTTEWSILNSK